MLATINSLPSRAARRTWTLLALAAAPVLIWPTIQAAPPAQNSTRENSGSASNNSKNPTVDAAAVPGLPGRDGNINVAVEYLPRPTAEEAKILRALEMPFDVDHLDTPFEECLKSLGEKAGIRIVPDARRLTEAGIPLDAPITLSLHDRSLELVLKRILETFGDDPNSKTPNLGFFVEDDELKITLDAHASGTLVTYWYPVWDLLPRTAGPDSEPANLHVSNKVAAGMPSPLPLQIATQRHDFTLIDAITTTIQPDSWEDLNGPGSMAYAREIGCLVIRQTQPTHREIVKLLRLWREARDLRQTATSGDVPGTTK
jgi:hypothetical protein